MSNRRGDANWLRSASAMQGQSFMKSLFCGAIEEDLIFPWPEPPPPRAAAVQSTLERVRRFFAERVDSAEIDPKERIPHADAVFTINLHHIQHNPKHPPLNPHTP